MPFALTCIADHHGPFVTDATGFEVTYLGAWEPPLFPHIRPEAAAYPVIELFRQSCRQSRLEVPLPAAQILIEFLNDLELAPPPFAGCDFTHLIPKAPKGLAGSAFQYSI